MIKLVELFGGIGAVRKAVEIDALERLDIEKQDS